MIEVIGKCVRVCNLYGVANMKVGLFVIKIHLIVLK